MQAIAVSSSQGACEGRARNRVIIDKHRAELKGYVEKYHTRISSVIDLDTKQLVMAMAEAVLDPEVGTTSYKVLEVAIDMSQVLETYKCNIFQCFGDMLKDEVMRLSITLKKLQSKHTQVVENFRKEKINSRALMNNIRTLQGVIKGKEKGGTDP